MKKIMLISTVLLTVFSSCAKKEYEFPDAVPQDRTPYNSVKVQMPGDFQFAAGDVVSGWKLVGSGKEYDFTTANGGNPAEFSLPENAAGATQIAYLLYSDAAVDSLWRGEFFLQIPQTQEAVENGFDRKLWLSAGHKTDDVTVLTPVVGALQFKITQADVYACEISSKGGNAVAGPVMIAMNKDIKASKVEKSSGTVKVYGGLTAGKTYNAVVMADEYASLDVRLLGPTGATVWENTIDVFAQLKGGDVLNIGDFGNPDISSLSLSMTSSEFAGGKLKKVCVYKEDGTRLFGEEFDNDFISGNALTVRIPGVEPADYSSSKLWFEITIEEQNGGTYILPLKEDGFEIGKGTELAVNLGELSKDRNAAPWFYPYPDLRLRSGDGYAYGEANTFLIQCKSSCYTGSVIDNPDIPGSVRIDYRLRGGLFSGPEPVGVEFEWLQGYNKSTPAWSKYTMDRTNIYNCDKYSFVADEDNFTVTVTNDGAHAGSPILLMKKDGKVLWAWTFWNIAADGTKLEAVDFGGVKIANMDIGHCSDKISSITPKIKFIRQSCNYYQWGRPIPVFSADGAGISLGQNDVRNATNPRVPVYDSGATTVSDAIAHPGTFIQNAYTKGSANKELADWLKDGVAANKDLWGGTAKDGTGIKSIYDPCPKGWRVPDAKTYLTLFKTPVKGYSTETYPPETTAGFQGVRVNGVLFVTNGALTAQTDKEGFVWQVAFTPKAEATSKDAALFWTNTCAEEGNASQCYVFRADYRDSKLLNGAENPDRKIGVDAANAGKGLPVRCQKDEDNR